MELGVKPSRAIFRQVTGLAAQTWTIFSSSSHRMTVSCSRRVRPNPPAFSLGPTRPGCCEIPYPALPLPPLPTAARPADAEEIVRAGHRQRQVLELRCAREERIRGATDRGR